MTDRASKQAAPQGSVTAAERAISALVGYTAGAAVVLPFDRVKSLMQVSEDAWRRGAWATARHLFATSGVAGLYKGGGPHMLIACAPMSGLQLPTTILGTAPHPSAPWAHQSIRGSNPATAVRTQCFTTYSMTSSSREGARPRLLTAPLGTRSCR